MTPETPREFGDELRRERELREVTREQLAVVTKVSLRQIEALETGRFEALPALVFSRGFVQSIAVYLGLDPQRTTVGFSHVYRNWAVTQPQVDQGPASGTHPVISRRTVRSSTTLLGVAIAAILAVVTGAAALLKSRNATERSATLAAPAAVPERPGSGPASLALPAEIAAATVPLPPTSAPPASSAAAPATAEPVQRVSRESASAPAAGALTLTLTFRDDCWTEVNVDGRMQMAELVRRGATREFSGGKFTLTLGNPAGVSISLDGRAIPTEGKAGEVLRNFVIDDATPRRFPVRG